jgi:hypothetical protein
MKYTAPKNSRSYCRTRIINFRTAFIAVFPMLLLRAIFGIQVFSPAAYFLRSCATFDQSAGWAFICCPSLYGATTYLEGSQRL